MQIFIIGSINTIRKRSIIEIKSINEALEIAALEIFPVIKYSVTISGENASIILHNAII